MRGSAPGQEESKKAGRSNDEAFLKDKYENCLGNREGKNLPWGCDGTAEIQREGCDFIRALGATEAPCARQREEEDEAGEPAGLFKST